MRIEYGDETLRRLAEECDFRSPRWSKELVTAYRKKIQILHAARDERDLLQMRSLRLERLVGDRVGQCSVRLNDQFRLVLRFRTDDGGRIVVILELVDYH